MERDQLNGQWAQVWAQVKNYPDTDASQVDAFFSRLEPQAMSDAFLMVTADNDFIKSWVEQHYTDVIVRALRDLTGTTYAVAIAVDPSQEQRQSAAAGFANTANEPVRSTPVPAAQEPPAPDSTPWPALADNPPSPEPAPQVAVAPAPSAVPGASSLTFENFVVGDSNRMAYSMALEVADNPGRGALNPLFIYGKSGLGKTHLMRSIQNYIEKTRPGLRTVYMDTQDFISKYSEAGAVKDREKTSFINFRDYYEQADVLLFDDVQHLQGKKESTSMLFQLFNTLTSQGKQIVLSADRAPKNIDVDERLRSRFYSGGSVDIQPPEVETKLGIVKSFINEYSHSEGFGPISLSEEIQMYIAENSGSNVRELQGAVNTVIYRMVYSDRADITLEEVRDLLANHFTGGASRALTVEDIQREVENFFKVSHSDMVGPKRMRFIAHPRQVAIYLCRQLLDLPYDAIGTKFNRDHSTAIHSAGKVEELLKTDRDTQEEIEILTKIICELD